VPENRRDPDSRPIALVFAILHSTAERPGPPLIYLHGGPGGSATGAVRDPDAMTEWARFLDLGDVVLLDQRGCGRSEPALARPLAEPPPTDAFADLDAFSGFLAQAGRAVKAELEAEGVDLAGYDTEQSADDVADLIRAVGDGRGRILGFSYGTHLGLSVLRRHPGLVESAILVGVEGPDETQKLPSVYDVHLRRLAALVRRDPVVGEQVPDLVGLYERVIRKLEREPMEVEVVQPVSNERVRVPVGPDGLRMILVRDFGDTSDLPVFPRLLASIERGDPTLLRWFVQKRYGVDAYPTPVFTVDTASGVGPWREQRIAAEAEWSLIGNAMNAFYVPAVEAVWGMPVLDDSFRRPFACEVRTLFVSGSLDANTPPHQAERMRWGFCDAVHLIQANGGHEDWMRNPKVLPVLHAFLAGEDVSHADVDLPPLRFVPIEGPPGDVTHPSLSG